MKIQLQEKTMYTMDDQREIKTLWCTKMDNIDYLKKLSDSMPRRLAEVLEREGGTTKY